MIAAVLAAAVFAAVWIPKSIREDRADAAAHPRGAGTLWEDTAA